MSISLSADNCPTLSPGTHRTVSTVHITGAHALKIFSGDSSALDALRVWLNDPESATNDAGPDMLRDVIYSPGLAHILAHSCASDSELTTADILDNLPLWPPILRAKKALTPVERTIAKHMLSDVVLFECMNPMTESDSRTMQAVSRLDLENGKSGYAGTPTDYEDQDEDNSDPSPSDCSESDMCDVRTMVTNESVYRALQHVFDGLVLTNAVFVFLSCEGQTFQCVRHPEHQTLHISSLDYPKIDLKSFRDNLSRLAADELGYLGGVRSSFIKEVMASRNVSILGLD